MYARACLENHSTGLRPYLVTVYPVRHPNWVLHPIKCVANPGESFFKHALLVIKNHGKELRCISTGLIIIQN